MKTKGFNLLSWAALSLVLVLLDQYTKLLAVAHLKGKTPLVILDGVFELLYSENRGAAFGMLQGKQGFFFLIGSLFANWLQIPYGIASISNSVNIGLFGLLWMVSAGFVVALLDRLTREREL